MQNEFYSNIIYENFFIVLNKIFNKPSDMRVKAVFKPNSLDFQIQPNLLFPLLLFLKYNSYTLFRSLIDITVYDFFSNTAVPSTRFHIRYFLLSHYFNIRLTLMFAISQTYKPIASITLIYKNAMWSEREIWDMFGLIFYGNQNLRRLLTDYGFPSHPLRKDYPLTGFSELIYDSAIKKLRYSKVELSQAFRVFSYWKLWKNP